MAGYGIQFDDIPGYVDQNYNDQQSQGGAANGYGSAVSGTATLQASGIIILLALAALWALAYWFRKG